MLRLIRLFFRTIGRWWPDFGAKVAYKMFITPRQRARHSSSDHIIESARISEMLYGKHFIKCYEWGPGDAPLVLLVHGWESRGTAMRSFVPDLLAAGFRVATFDGPAHGDSGGSTTNMHDFSGVLRAVIQRLGGKVHAVVAHSFGGSATVFTFAFRAPELSLAALVLIGVPSNTRNVFSRFARMGGLSEGVMRRVYARAERIVGYSIDEVDNTMAHARMQLGRAMVVHDRYDDIVPFAEGRAIAEAWPGAYLLATERLGHYRLMKDERVIRRVVDFVHGA